MSNGRSKSKSRKAKVVGVVVAKPTHKKVGKHGAKHGRVPTQNAFSVSAGYNKKDGWGGKLAYTSDAYSQHAKYDVPAKLGKRGKERLGGLGQGVNEYGQHNPNKDTVVPFNELLGTIVGSSDFALTSYDINPGQAGTFPQTSIEAALYERYNFNSLEFYLTPLVTTFTSGGKILMSCDLEGAEEPDPSSVSLMENNTIHSDGMPHQSMGFELAGVVRHRKSWFVRPGVYPGGADPRLYDVGRLYVATYGNPAGLVGIPIAELRVRGSVKLMDKLSEPTGLALPHNLSQFSRRCLGSQLTFGAWTAFNWSTNADKIVAADEITSSGWTIKANSLALVAPKLTSYYKVTVCVGYRAGAATLVQLFLRALVNGVAVGGACYPNGGGAPDITCGQSQKTAAPLDVDDWMTATADWVQGFIEGDELSFNYNIYTDSTPASGAFFLNVSLLTV